MPLTGAQSILKKLLPSGIFRFVYNLASGCYVIWIKTLDYLYYFLAHSYYLLTHNREKLNRIKRVKTIRPYSMVGRAGLFRTHDIAAEMEKQKVYGCFVECGVARGGCSALMALVAADHNSNRKLWLFDSFEGLSEPTAEDEYRESLRYTPGNRSSDLVAPGYCLGTFEEVESLLFSKLGLNRDNIFMVRGWFRDTLPEYRDNTGAIAILRIDGDWYESTKCCLEYLYDNVIPGGSIIIDDYESYVGAKKATDEFIKERDIKTGLSFDGRGGCYFQKP
jgi:O-methyltransferase